MSCAALSQAPALNLSGWLMARWQEDRRNTQVVAPRRIRGGGGEWQRDRRGDEHPECAGTERAVPILTRIP
jgi:hypothetical protein